MFNAQMIKHEQTIDNTSGAEVGGTGAGGGGGPNQILLKVKMTLLAVLSVKAIHVSACQCINPSEDL